MAHDTETSIGVIFWYSL